MPQQVLLLVEATGIQNYIFGSNQLVQNIGASELVQRATTDWVYEALPTSCNVVRDDTDPDGWKITEQTLQGDGLLAEVVYAGGGNAMILFTDTEDAVSGAKAFTRQLTRRVLEHAPGLGIVVAWQALDSRPLKDVHQGLRQRLALRKLDRPRNVPLLGLSVTAECKFTGAPAVDSDDGRLISAEVRKKLDAKEAAETRLVRHLSGVKLAGFEFLNDFNKMGAKGESSYLAVVHTDGNSMGERIRRIGERCGDDDEAYVRELRKFSSSVGSAARSALNRTVGMLLDPNNLRRPREDNGSLQYVLADKVPVPLSDDGKDRLPFRPIVFGGDDVTFVCEGRLGLELAAKYLNEFTTEPLADGERAYARAGVAVVKSHYPFSRAYDLAEELCKSAKKRIKELEQEGEKGATVLDWHFATGGLVLPLPKVRQREYNSETGHTLLMRPVSLDDSSGSWRSWQMFTALVDDFQKKNGDWYGRRNKAKALRDALRAGPEAVRLFLDMSGGKLLDIPKRPDMRIQGWQGQECGYFDAVEALDFFVPLEGGVA